MGHLNLNGSKTHSYVEFITKRKRNEFFTQSIVEKEDQV